MAKTKTKSKTGTVYKVVSVESNGTFSSYLGDYLGIAKLAYPINKKVVPVKGTKIFAFQTLEEAQLYLGLSTHSRRYAIFRAEASGITVGRLRKFPLFLNKTDSLKTVQHCYETRIDSLDNRGCVLCDSITLVEEAK